MKAFSKIQWLTLGLVLCGSLAHGADPAKPVHVKPVPAKSIFVMPSAAKEGRDPFFPESTRVYEANVPASVHVAEITTLKVKGYSMVNNQPMVIINNHSFMIGDEGDVLTSGGRVHVRCLDIKAGVAVIDANGIREDLHF